MAASTLACSVRQCWLMAPESASTLHFGQREWQLAYRVALRVVRVPDQAEDVAQEALMNAYAARHSFAGRARPDSWLYRIAFNTALSHLRRPYRRRHVDTDVGEMLDRAADSKQSPEDVAMASELADSLGECLRCLRPKDRMAFTERFLLGTTEKELGVLLGTSTNAAKQRAFRARRTVRTYFATRAPANERDSPLRGRQEKAS